MLLPAPTRKNLRFAVCLTLAAAGLGFPLLLLSLTAEDGPSAGGRQISESGGPGSKPRLAYPTAQSRPKPGGAMSGGGGGSPKNASGTNRFPHVPRVVEHSNGWHTATLPERRGELRQNTFNAAGELVEARIFKADEAGRLRNGMIFDGRKNPIGSTRYYYDPNSSQLLMEELFNKSGDLVRRVYSPGALKEPEFAGRTVALAFPPGERNSKGEEIHEAVSPIVPVSADQESFVPFHMPDAAF